VAEGQEELPEPSLDRLQSQAYCTSLLRRYLVCPPPLSPLHVSRQHYHRYRRAWLTFASSTDQLCQRSPPDQPVPARAHALRVLSIPDLVRFVGEYM
jgi:hypothetical protein